MYPIETFFERQNSRGLILGRSSLCMSISFDLQSGQILHGNQCRGEVCFYGQPCSQTQGSCPIDPNFLRPYARCPPPRNWRGRDNSAVNFGELLYICLRPRRMPQRNQLLRGYQTRWEVTFYRVLHAPWPKRRISKNIFMTAIPVWRIRMLLRNLYACGS